MPTRDFCGLSSFPIDSQPASGGKQSRYQMTKDVGRKDAGEMAQKEPSEQEDPEESIRPTRFISADDGRCFRNRDVIFFVIPLFQLNRSLTLRTILVEKSGKKK